MGCHPHEVAVPPVSSMRHSCSSLPPLEKDSFKVGELKHAQYMQWRQAKVVWHLSPKRPRCGEDLQDGINSLHHEPSARNPPTSSVFKKVELGHSQSCIVHGRSQGVSPLSADYGKLCKKMQIVCTLAHSYMLGMPNSFRSTDDGYKAWQDDIHSYRPNLFIPAHSLLRPLPHPPTEVTVH